MVKHEIKSFEITQSGGMDTVVVGVAVCSCGEKFTTQHPNNEYRAGNDLRRLCDDHTGVIVEEAEPGTEKGEHSHSFQCYNKLRDGRDDNSRWRIALRCSCGAEKTIYITPIGNDPDDQNSGSKLCRHNMIFNFEIQRNYDTDRPGWKQFFRCTKCSKTTWDIEYHY